MTAATAKGEARRVALLDAVLRVVESSGPAAVTHRAVAREAAVPVAAATYYFAGIDDLLVSALVRATDAQVVDFDRLKSGDIRAFAAVLHTWTNESRASTIAQYELLFLAMHRESLRDAADGWYRALENAVDELVADPHRARVISFAIDGLILRMLWRHTPSSVTEIEGALTDILETATR